MAGLADLERALAADTWPPVVLIAGPDAEARRVALAAIVAALPEDERTTAVDRFTDGPVARAIDAARTPSLLGGRRVVVVDDPPGHADGDEQARAALLEAVRRPVPGNLLVLVSEKADGRLALVKEIAKRGVRVDCARPKEREMPAFIDGRASDRGLRLGPRIAEAIAEAVGDDPALVARELDKLELVAEGGGRRGRVVEDPLLVEALLRPGRAVGAFELEDALLDGRTGAGLVALSRHLARGGAGDALPLLGRLSGIARRLSVADAVVSRGGSEQDVRAALSCHPFVAQKYARAARRLAGCGERALAACVAADGRLKSGGDPEAALAGVVLAFGREAGASPAPRRGS